MSKRYLVLDQNKLRAHRAPEVVRMLKASPETHFVLPDVAFIEMTKNPGHRTDSIKTSLELLAPFHQRVHIARAIGGGLRFELDKKKSSARHMLLSEATYFARNILRSLKSNTDGFELQRIRTDPDEHHDAIARDYFNHQLNKETVSTLIVAMKNTLTESVQKSLRTNRASNNDILNIIHTIAPDLLCEILQADEKMSLGKARSLIKQHPILLRYYYSRMWLCIDWIKNGGFESIPAEKITNDLIDHDYVITATCFTGLITGDGRASDAYSDMVTLLSKPISWRNNFSNCSRSGLL